MSNYDLDRPGWYLLASEENKSCYDIFNGGTYSHPVSLDISCVYIPLLDNSSTNTLIDLDNSNSITDITSLQDLSFGTNIGVCIPNYYHTQPYLFGKISDLSSQKFTVKIGIWMNLYEKTVNPILNIKITQKNQNGNPLFLEYNDNTFTSPIGLSFTTDNSFSLTLQRRYEFKLNDIDYSVVPSSSNIIDFTDDLSDTNKNYIDLSGFNNNGLLNTDVSGNVGFIKYTIINATTNPDTSFNVTINLFVEDTIFPTIRFTKDLCNNNINLPNIYTLVNSNSSLDFSGENNNATTIRINQSTIRDNLSIDFTPIPIAYDQDNIAFTFSNEKINNSYSNSTITYYQGNSSTTEDISYSSGEYMPGTYTIIYEVSDEYEHTTKVDVSFEIVDDINPVLTISNNLQNSGNPEVYFSNGNLSLNTDYRNFSNTDKSSGIGVNFSNLNTFNTDISTNSNRSVNFYIKYSEITGNNWLMPDILSGTDFSGIILPNNQLQSFALSELDYLDISNVILEETYRQLANPPQNYLQRRYTATDYADNSSNITANIRIIDDTIPVVDVSYIHTLFKINTSRNNGVTDSTDILGIPQQILSSNNIVDNSSIVISLYDDIKFDFSMNKPCKCQIDISKNGLITAPSIELQANNYSRNQTITLNQTHTNVSGLNQLYFTIYDENNNYLKFKYDLSINDIPQYTFRIAQDPLDDLKQKLLLRAAGSPYQDKYLFYFAIKTKATWSNADATNTFIYSSNAFGIDSDNSSLLTVGSTGIISLFVNNGDTQKINTSSTISNTYYEIISLFPQQYTSIIDISFIDQFKAGTSPLEYNLALINYPDISNSIGFYTNSNSINLSYNI